MLIDPQESILQFGTGKFLRCFVDLFVHETNQGTTTPRGIVAVQSTGCERVLALKAQGGRYHVAIRGLSQGQRVDRTIEVTSVGRALAAADAWHEVLAIARGEALEAIVSNVTEAGYETDTEDAAENAPPHSFPGKLLAVLQARWRADLPGVAILPCELIDDNAVRLKALLTELALARDLPMAFVQWLDTECSWHNTLVDRIVSAPAADDPLGRHDPLFAVAEPFAQWLIEGTMAVPGLSTHPAVGVVEDLAPHHLRKVRILNGAHTALVSKALPLGIETVRQAVEDARVRPWLEELLFGEILPALEGRVETPREFAETTLERFSNPFLEHRLADIALHHEVKVKTRLLPTHAEFRERFGQMPPLLEEIIGGGP